MVPRPTASCPHATACAGSDTPEPASPLDEVLLAEIGRTLGAARLAELLKLLAVELERKPRLIREAVADADLHRAAHEAHSLKGAAACLGAEAVAKAAGELEEALTASLFYCQRAVPCTLRRMSGAIAATHSNLISRGAGLPTAGLAA